MHSRKSNTSGFKHTKKYLIHRIIYIWTLGLRCVLCVYAFFVCFVCVCVTCMPMCRSQRRMSGVLVSPGFYSISLRHGLLLNLELDWWPTSSKEHSVFVLHSSGVTGACWHA